MNDKWFICMVHAYIETAVYLIRELCVYVGVGVCKHKGCFRVLKWKGNKHDARIVFKFISDVVIEFRNANCWMSVTSDYKSPIFLIEAEIAHCKSNRFFRSMNSKIDLTKGLA